MKNLDEMYDAFTELCGVPQPNVAREELDASFGAWCADLGVPADYASRAAAYLAYLETPDRPAPHPCGPDCPCACLSR